MWFLIRLQNCLLFQDYRFRFIKKKILPGYSDIFSPYKHFLKNCKIQFCVVNNWFLFNNHTSNIIKKAQKPQEKLN